MSSSTRKSKEISAEAREQYEKLDYLVDERSRYRNMLRNNMYADSPELKEEAVKAIEQLNEQILIRLEPYLAKFILLLTGRLPARSWNADTYRFLYLLSGKRDNRPEAHEKALSWVRRVIAEHLCPDIQDSTIADEDFHQGEPIDVITEMVSNQVRSTPLYTELVTITIDIVDAYKVIYKIQDGERINFIHAFMTQFKYRLKQWITKQGRDVMGYCFRVTVEDEEEEDNRKSRPRTLDNMAGEKLDRPTPGMSFTTFEEFLATRNEPWVRLTQRQREVMWNKVILGMKPETIAEEMGMTKSQVTNEVSLAKETIKQASACCPQLRSGPRNALQVFN